MIVSWQHCLTSFTLKASTPNICHELLEHFRDLIYHYHIFIFLIYHYHIFIFYTDYIINGYISLVLSSLFATSSPIKSLLLEQRLQLYSVHSFRSDYKIELSDNMYAKMYG
uniref:Uncharacterized protein n=1 Tax=Glossina brevipalpis TaxID=37001 RepID=A0A1A9WWD6_9MUSC